ncbi:MAG: hypothetical protein ACRDT4_14405 [Micromonosporaceae bacterium]
MERASWDEMASMGVVRGFVTGHLACEEAAVERLPDLMLVLFDFDSHAHNGRTFGGLAARTL